MSVSTGIARANMMILPAISTLEPIAVSPASLHREAANSQIKLTPITFSTTDSISFASPACAAMPLNAGYCFADWFCQLKEQNDTKSHA